MGVAIIIVLIVTTFYLQSIESKTIPMTLCNGYICGDGTCVNGTRCDGVVQCDDGSDEMRCERQSSYCSSSQYRCPSTYYSNSRCIPSSYRCDGDRDCSDGSDERNCPSVSTCHYCYSSSTYQTYSRYVCSTRCDGNTECSDRSDEKNCPLDDSSAIIGIIVGSSVGGLFIFICCPTTIIIIVACAVYHASKSGQHTITTTTTGGSATTGAHGGTTDQPGFQLQNLGNEKPLAQTTESDVEAVTSGLTQQAPPPYAGIKPVLYLPSQK